jgi:parvulin-like peptidyl-prolyl isomerase
MPLPELNTPPATRPRPAPAAALVDPAPASADPVPPSTAQRRATPRRDAQIVRTSLQKSGASPGGKRREWKQAGVAAARVGDEIVTFHDLLVAVKEFVKRNNFKNIPREQVNEIASGVLNGLIERSLLVQEAKREIKTPAKLDQFMKVADQIWREEHLTPLKARYALDTEQQVRERLAEEGRSLDAMQQGFRQDFLAQSYLIEKLKDRVKVDLNDLLRYYNQHVRDRDNDRPAQITWREVVVEVDKSASRDEARRKADALREKLVRGADFAQLARTASDGPTTSRTQGGLMQTSPGGYAVAAVNAALQALPIGQISPVLEGTSSFHIVRVENRRPAGPASFEEVQDQIRSTLTEQRFKAEREAFIARLRQRTFISNVFEGTESDPSRAVQ